MESIKKINLEGNNKGAYLIEVINKDDVIYRKVELQ